LILDGLEIAGIGMGMVSLALVTILVTIFVLRFAIDQIEQRKQQSSAVQVPHPEAQHVPPSATVETPPASSSKAAKAAAIAVALYLSEEEEKSRGG